MHPRSPLPDEFASSAFTRSSARDAGLRDGRLRRKDLRAPFAGVRTAAPPPETILERCREYAPRLKDGQFFTHGTAALLLGIPVPRWIEEEVVVHVGAVRPADAPHAQRMIGHRLLVQPRLVRVGGLPVVDQAEVFCQLGAALGLEDLVVVADHLLNITALDEEAAKTVLLDRISAVRRIGAARLVKAVRAARRGSGSPAETRVRLVLEAAGLPRPQLNEKLFDEQDRYLGKPDFVWREQRTVLEYEGAGHREEEQFQYDVLRYDDLVHAGWRVLRATADDLTPEGRRRLVARVRRALV